jgi:hypothetical protein
LRKKKGENFLCRLQLCGVYLGSWVLLSSLQLFWMSCSPNC